MNFRKVNLTKNDFGTWQLKLEKCYNLELSIVYILSSTVACCMARGGCVSASPLTLSLKSKQLESKLEQHFCGIPYKQDITNVLAGLRHT